MVRSIFHSPCEGRSPSSGAHTAESFYSVLLSTGPGHRCDLDPSAAALAPAPGADGGSWLRSPEGPPISTLRHLRHRPATSEAWATSASFASVQTFRLREDPSSQAPSTIDPRSAGASRWPDPADGIRNASVTLGSGTHDVGYPLPSGSTHDAEPKPLALRRSTSMASATEDSQTRVRDLRELILPGKPERARRFVLSNALFLIHNSPPTLSTAGNPYDSQFFPRLSTALGQGRFSKTPFLPI